MAKILQNINFVVGVFLPMSRQTNKCLSTIVVHSHRVIQGSGFVTHSHFFLPFSLMKPLAYLKRRMRYGFTLIELLLVIGIIAILASIVIVAINPTKQLGDARNAQRRSDVNTILNAVYQYSIDNNGTLPSTIDTTNTEICASGAELCTSSISLDVLTGTQLIAIPQDPQNATTSGTNYFIYKTGSRVIVSAPAAEQGVTIAVTR